MDCHGFSLMTKLLVAASLNLCIAITSAEPISPLEVPQRADSKEVELGKHLFHSVLLSTDNSISCSSCHNVSEGGDDGLRFSVGVDGKIGTINSPTVLNSGFNTFQFWDGRASSLEEQVEGPIHNPVEMASDWEEVINKLGSVEKIRKAFEEIYSTGITKGNIAKAIAVYERQLVTLNSPFDQYLKGDGDAINTQAKEGYQLFKGMGCVSCHQGKNVGGNMFQYFGITGDYFEDRGNISESDYGRFNVTGLESDRFKFKVPSLRNIGLTAPYFHDGSAATLEEAIRTMAKYQLGRPITENQVVKIKAFLKTLTGKVREGLF